jgi:hypothetical protein
VQEACALDPLESVGFVIKDVNGAHLKVKSAQYVALRKLCYALEDQRRVDRLLLDIAKTNQNQHFLELFPQWRHKFASIGEHYSSFCVKFQQLFDQLHPLGDHEFAKQANKFKFYGALFGIRKHVARSAREYFATIRIDVVMTAMDQFREHGFM